MGSLAAGGAAAMGTGAFTSVEANRSVTVNTAGDASAYLAMKPDSGPNGDYAQWAGDGSETLTLDFSNSNNDVDGGGAGVNNKAKFRADRVFTITNQGTQDVWVWFDDADAGSEYDNSPANDVVGYPGSTDGPFDIWFYHFGARSPEQALDGAAGYVNLGPGDSSRIGVAINTDNGAGLGEYTVPVNMIASDTRPDDKPTPEGVDNKSGF